ncbi:hypothetical protein MTsPCn5_38130 [Croceitalea sp. MTPC5]|uniref:universal stress protein n=1 Tax=Croceitalea sp. MTPC5 TaxID=3056565 RepID=UPI002B372F8C|nr:hypothetical protein MTsPCn5_38130 [Croceitalea sp. MTPC5]
MKHIMLIANVDGQSQQLLRYVSKMCKALDLRLHILQIDETREPIFLSSPHYYNKVGILFSKEREQKRKDLEAYVAKNTNDVIDSDWVSVKMVRGVVDKSLEAFINEEKIDLIIASQAVFKISEFKEQSIFRQVLLNVSELPTLIVPNNHSFKSLLNTAYLTTLRGDDYAYIKWIKNNFLETVIKVLHFSENEPSVENRKKMNYILSELGENAFTYENRKEDIENFVTREASTENPEFDLIALRTKKRNFWERLMDPSTALNIILRLDTPTLLFKYSEND